MSASNPLGLSGHEGSASSLDLIFVDGSVGDRHSLIEGIPISPDSQMMVVALDSTADGIEQISEALASYDTQEVAAVHIFAHGDAGSLQLGSGQLSEENLAQYQSDLTGWADALAEDGDILLYGCNVAEGLVGQEFVHQIAQLTGADVAASDDLTGSSGLGGDWDLEFETGAIDAAIALDDLTQATYGSTLALGVSVGYVN